MNVFISSFDHKCTTGPLSRDLVEKKTIHIKQIQNNYVQTHTVRNVYRLCNNKQKTDGELLHGASVIVNDTVRCVPTQLAQCEKLTSDHLRQHRREMVGWGVFFSIFPANFFSYLSDRFS